MRIERFSCLPFPTPVSAGSGSKGLISGRSGHPQASCCGAMVPPRVRERTHLPPQWAIQREGVLAPRHALSSLTPANA